MIETWELYNNKGELTTAYTENLALFIQFATILLGLGREKILPRIQLDQYSGLGVANSILVIE